MAQKPKQQRRPSPSSLARKRRLDIALTHPRQDGETAEQHIEFLKQLWRWVEDGVAPSERKPRLKVDNTQPGVA